MYYDFKIYLDQSKTDVCFHALIANEIVYRIVEDLNGLYKDLFVEIIEGKYTYSYLWKSELSIDMDYIPEIRKETINTGNAIDNLNAFITLQAFINEYPSALSSDYVQQYDLFSVRFEGSNFGYKEGMSPEYTKNAIVGVDSLYNVIAANNISGEPFQYQKAGSFEINLMTTKTEDIVIKTFKEILEDIKNKKLNKDKFLSEVDKTYRRVIEELSNLLKMKGLKFIELKIAGQTYKIDDRIFLKNAIKKIYDTSEIKVTGYLKSVDFANKTFQIEPNGGPIVYCHLLESKEEKLFKLVDDRGNREKLFTINGYKIQPQTVEVHNIIVK